MSKASCPVLFVVSLSFMSGIICSRALSVPLLIVYLTILVLATIVIRWPSKVWIILVLFVLLGFSYSQSFDLLHHYHIVHTAKYYRYKPMTLHGVIVSEIKSKKLKNTVKTSFILDLDAVDTGYKTRKVRGKVLVNVFEDFGHQYGDIIQIYGRLHKPFEFSDNTSFSYRKYLKNKHVHFVFSVKKGNPIRVVGRNKRHIVRTMLYQLRQTTIDHMARYLTWQEQGVLNALLLGERSAIPHNIRELFIRTGTAHILSISGLHVGIVAILIMSLLQVFRVPRLWQLIFAGIILLAYVLLAGARPSIVRASLMAMIFMGGLIMDRESNSLTMLSFASLVILLINPYNLYDIGFQLSFMCVWSIIFFRPKLQKCFAGMFKRAKYPRWLRGVWQSILVSMSVCIGIEPLVVYYFQIVTPITILANIFIIPLVGIVVCVGFGFMLIVAWCDPLAVLFSVCLKVLLNIMVAISFLLAQIPYGCIFIKNINYWHLITYYSIILMIFLMPWGIIADKFRYKRLKHNN